MAISILISLFASILISIQCVADADSEAKQIKDGFKDKTNSKWFTDEDEKLHELMVDVADEYKKQEIKFSVKDFENLFWKWNTDHCNIKWNRSNKKQKFTGCHIRRMLRGKSAMRKTGNFHMVVKQFLTHELHISISESVN